MGPLLIGLLENLRIFIKKQTKKKLDISGISQKRRTKYFFKFKLNFLFITIENTSLHFNHRKSA